MTPKFRLTVISAAIASTLLAPTVNAQNSTKEEKQTNEKDIEIIEVTGFKGSLRKAINSKRFSDGIVDSIHAEDVGKSTDQNIADALSRVTGVTVQEEDGEGTRISVRGAGAALNQISLNGVAITSGLNGSDGTGSSDQSVDLSSFSSDILASIDVVKTPSADHDEGSLGANVILRTVKPLNLSKDRRSVEVQGRYNGYSDEFDRKLSASVSHKMLDNSVGLILTISDETQNTRRDQLGGRWDDEIGLIEAGRARDAKTGEVIESDTWALARTNSNMSLNLNERNRRTANLGLQYRPYDSTDIQLDVSHTQQEIKTDWMNISARGDMPWRQYNSSELRHRSSRRLVDR
ncbi:TonB-dependent receptor plug domain-containing protein [Paraglaciecola aquimarina]|uniref:TonB-dependent receptor plug domain-containing protein n=1 Tax=Paraglaciecola aquimarina TaxID=1235557 RepID=A0ABU3SXP5_9ALTE|nr:TonB-dependent receptor plug domain-containing protein [Paraglaciecola aquimarina]MDU0354773.1 TonB-dependent receptor plug domain-containing protein [Paraglaciecola aquimarina]